MRPDPRLIVTALELGNTTVAKIRQNLLGVLLQRNLYPPGCIRLLNARFSRGCNGLE